MPVYFCKETDIESEMRKKLMPLKIENDQGQVTRFPSLSKGHCVICAYNESGIEGMTDMYVCQTLQDIQELIDKHRNRSALEISWYDAPLWISPLLLVSLQPQPIYFGKEKDIESEMRKKLTPLKIEDYQGQVTRFPSLDNGYHVVCAYNKSGMEGMADMYICRTLQDMQELLTGYRNGGALKISWYKYALSALPVSEVDQQSVADFPAPSEIKTATKALASNFYKPEKRNIHPDKRLISSNQQNVLYTSKSYLPIDDATLRSYGFLDGQWRRGRDGIDHLLTIYNSVKSAQQCIVEESRNAKSKSLR